MNAFNMLDTSKQCMEILELNIITPVYIKTETFGTDV